MQLQTTSLYASILALMLVVLSAMVIAARAKTKISIYHGENASLAVQIRRHGNFIEYVPMALIVMGLAEAGGASPLLLNSAGVILTASRLIHPFGLRHDKADTMPRIIGGTGTLIAILLCAGAILWQYLGN
jgi:uncharacterized protein